MSFQLWQIYRIWTLDLKTEIYEKNKSTVPLILSTYSNFTKSSHQIFDWEWQMSHRNVAVFLVSGVIGFYNTLKNMPWIWSFPLDVLSNGFVLYANVVLVHQKLASNLSQTMPDTAMVSLIVLPIISHHELGPIQMGR
jgi:hypothetical protein